MRTAREISALLTTSKQQFQEGLFNILAILDTITRDDVYVIFGEAVNKMARKCQTASSLSFSSDFKAVRGVHTPVSVSRAFCSTDEEKRDTARSLRKCKINGETLNLMCLCIGKIFQPYHFKMVSAVPGNTITVKLTLRVI